MNRRTFSQWIGLGWFTSLLLPILVACNFKRIAAKPRSDGFVAVGNVSELDQSAGQLQVQVGNTPFIVVGVLFSRRPLLHSIPPALTPDAVCSGKMTRGSLSVLVMAPSLIRLGRSLKAQPDEI